MRLRCLPLAACLLAAPQAALPQATPPPSYAVAEILPSRTSIYLGSVSLSVQPMPRRGTEYSSTYTATVFPFFFFNEQGRFRIVVSDADLMRLASGQPIDFIGDALRDDGAGRLVQGHATPRGPTGGDVKIRVFLSRHFVLVFNTTYRLTGESK